MYYPQRWTCRVLRSQMGLIHPHWIGVLPETKCQDISTFNMTGSDCQWFVKPPLYFTDLIWWYIFLLQCDFFKLNFILLILNSYQAFTFSIRSSSTCSVHWFNVKELPFQQRLQLKVESSNMRVVHQLLWLDGQAEARYDQTVVKGQKQ